jgi:hypothetical protein
MIFSFQSESPISSSLVLIRAALPHCQANNITYVVTCQGGLEGRWTIGLIQ